MSGPTQLDPAMVAWSRQHFSLMAEGGVWAVPRSGMVFRKDHGRLVLIAEMPYMVEMAGVITPEELREQQDGEFEAIREHFEAAGIPVERAET